MSEKSKQRRARREAKQEQQAKNIIGWIFGGLILLAIVFVIYIAMIS